MKSFIVVRLKEDAVSLHRVWTKLKLDAMELVWPDDSELIGKFVVDRAQLPSV
jgi:hypothetical protein